MNPKLFISNFYDSFINSIDIHTEEQLEKYQEIDEIQDTFRFNYKSSNLVNDDVYQIGPFIDPVSFGVEYHKDLYSESYQYGELNSRMRSVRPTKIHEYLNEVRNETIDQVRRAQADAFEKYESIKNEVNPREHVDNPEAFFDQLKQKVFANNFIGLIQVDRVNLANDEEPIVMNKLPFRLYLIVTDFYIDRHEQFLFG